jgi:hypothetical protein
MGGCMMRVPYRGGSCGLPALRAAVLFVRKKRRKERRKKKRKEKRKMYKFFQT